MALKRDIYKSATAYIYKIRNRDKREYALRYLDYLAGVTYEPEPVDIGTMAAQTVRMRLYDIVYPRVAA